MPFNLIRRKNKRASRFFLTVLAWLLFGVIVIGPLATIVVFSFSESIFRGASISTLKWYKMIFTEPALFAPLLRSLQIASIVVVIQLFVGTLIAYGTHRNRIIGAKLLDALSNITIALPSVVIGLALLAFYATYGPVSTLALAIFSTEFSLTWTLWIVVGAHVLETFPYMVRSVGAVLQKMDPHLESAARTLGASRRYAFRTIVLPQLRPGLVAGSVLAFSRSIAEFGATIIVVSAVLTTAPIKIFAEAEAGTMELAAAYSVILMAVSFTVYLSMTRWMARSPERPA